jgi:D-alanine-D-alanine ligase
MGERAAVREAASRATVLLLVDDTVWLPRSGKLLDGVSEAFVEQALRRFAGRVVVAPFESVDALLRALDEVAPDVVFNMTQVAHGDRRMDAHVCAVLELRGVAYTGTGPRGLMLCRDKALSKMLAREAGFAVPEHVVVEPGAGRGALGADVEAVFPLVVKPRFADGSEGVSQDSLVRTREELAARVESLRSSGYADIMREQYVPGREFVVGIVGERVILPPAEFVVANGGEGAPLLACARFKYDTAYRERWGISMEFAELTPRESESLASFSLRACAALGIRDYGSLDVKLTPSGEWAFIEANPNPGLSPSGKVFTGASGGLDFETLVAAITSSALRR